MRFIYLIFFLILLTFSACKKPISSTCENSPFTVLVNENYENEPKVSSYENSFFIINEGGFTYGNGSISAYNPNTKISENEIFKTVNGYSLGDIAQSIKTQNELTYICVNNSQKIEVVNTKTFERLRTITGFSSPRYLEFINETDILISDLYENSIQVINVVDGCELGKITTKAWTEEILKIGNDFWAIERNSIGEDEKFANLILLNTSDFSVSKRIEIPVEPNSIIQDKDNNLWILSSGFEDDNLLPQLIKFNTQSQSIEKSLSFPDFQNIAQNLAYNSVENSLYFNRANAIYKMFESDSNIPSAILFSSNAQLVYGLDFNENSNELYICDALDYVSPGKVFRYSATGNLIDEFPVGVLPNKVIF